MQYLDYLQDTLTIFMRHKFVKVPQSHFIHNSPLDDPGKK